MVPVLISLISIDWKVQSSLFCLLPNSDLEMCEAGDEGGGSGIRRPCDQAPAPLISHVTSETLPHVFRAL